MIKNQRTLATLAVVAMLCVTALLMAQGATKAPRPARVAVADVRKIFNSLDERTKMEADLNVMDQQILKEKETREQKIKDMALDLSMVGQSNADAVRMTDDLDKTRFEHGVWMQWQQQKRTREARLRTLDLYRKIAKAIEDAAKVNGYDLVLYTDDVDMELIKPDEVSALISSRRVLYSAADLDITESIITQMNNAFANNMPR
jgi:Skp family chaperone for outer membrane proteins